MLTAGAGWPLVARIAGVLVAVALAMVVIVRLWVLRTLRRRSRALEHVLSQAPIGVALFDADLRFLSVNPELERINHLPAEAHLGHRFSDLVDLPIARELEARMREVLRAGTPARDIRVEVTAPDNRVTISKVAYLPIPREMGVPLALAAVVDDITGEEGARRRAESVRRCAEALAGAGSREQCAEVLVHTLVPDIAPRAVVCLVDPADGALGTAAVAGYPEAMANRIRRFLDRADSTRPVAEAARTRTPVEVSTGTEFDRRYPGLARERELTGDASVLAAPVPTGPGGAIGAVIRLSWPEDHRIDEDVRVLLDTVVALFEGTLERIAGVEAGSEDRFRDALDAMLDDVAIGVAVRDEERRIVDFEIAWMNAHSRDGAGRTAEQLIGRRVLELYPGWREAGMFDAFRQVVETGEPLLLDEVPYRDTTADGSEIEGVWRMNVVPLGDGYLATSRDITAQVAEREQVRLAEEAERRERVAVELLQSAALPSRLPTTPGLALAARYLPATTDTPVGGDWYDAVELPDGRLAFIIGDVAGHGAEAATDMIQARNLLRGFVFSHDDPGSALTELNRCLISLWDLRNFATLLCCHVDPVARSMSVARAGHPPPLIVRGAHVTFEEVTGGPPVGCVPDARYPSVEVDLDGVDRIVAFTDGLVESRTIPLDEGMARFAGVVSTGPHRAHGPDALCSWILEHTPKNRPDDTCLLVADLSPRRAGDPAESP